MDAVYEYCTTHRLPVCFHVNPGPKTPGFADEFIATLKSIPNREKRAALDSIDRQTWSARRVT